MSSRSRFFDFNKILEIALFKLHYWIKRSGEDINCCIRDALIKASIWQQLLSQKREVQNYLRSLIKKRNIGRNYNKTTCGKFKSKRTFVLLYCHCSEMSSLWPSSKTDVFLEASLQKRLFETLSFAAF